MFKLQFSDKIFCKSETSELRDLSFDEVVDLVLHKCNESLVAVELRELSTYVLFDESIRSDINNPALSFGYITSVVMEKIIKSGLCSKSFPASTKFINKELTKSFKKTHIKEKMNSVFTQPS